MNTNKYIGLPFKANGRDETGLDCWGLVRLFYKNELNIELPSFSTQYAIEDDFRIQDLLSQYKEGWQKTEKPEPGSAVLFRILGEVTHIGVCVEDNKFLHIRENSDSVLESLDNLKWNRRIEGFYKYVENTGVVLNSAPHPLKTQKVTAIVPEGTTLKELIEKAKSESDFSEVSQYRVLVNGIPIQEELWSTFTLKNSDTVEYRCILGKNNKLARTLLTLVVVAAAVAVGGWAAGLAKGLGTFGSTLVGVSAGALTQAIGMKLVDAIAPIIPKDPNDPGTTERQLLIDGGANQAAKYSSIPVVLGKVKMTPPLGAEIFSVFSGDDSATGSETGTDNFLKILLIWGYGPLDIDYSTLKVGDVLLSEYSDVTQQHLNRITEPTTDELKLFDSIYGTDVQQLNGGELPGPKRIVDGVEKEALPPIGAGEPSSWVPATNVGDWVERAFSQPTERITVVLHFSQGLRRIVTQGEEAGAVAGAPIKIGIEYKVNNGTYVPWATKTIGGELDSNNYILSSSPKKDAFSWAITLNRGLRWEPTDLITIRIRRETGKEDEPNSILRYSHECVLHTITGYRNEKPAKDPLNVKIAKSAFSIKATEQINGRIEGINATVQSYCYDYTGTSWALRATNNPASLFRYVLTHPGTPNRILESEINSKIDLQKLQYWHNYCSLKGFTYNSIIASNNSVMGVLSEICAAGRASPAIVDGKWTVIIDEPQTNIIQHFTPHNSWNFEGSKDVVKYPDCLRARFNDEDNNYQEDEVLVYQAGKNDTNSELFEEISFPGVTKRSLVIDHARWHMAQAKLRPERYTLETDMEYLVCNRGDLVKVTHDVPLWGLGSGRLKAVLSNTQLELEEPVYLEVGKSYTIRIRKQDGTSVTSTISFTTTGEYSVINLSTALTGLNELDLYMFGELNKESQDLVVLSIQPTGTNTATITLTDYGVVTGSYNIFTDYLNYTELPSFVSNITKPPKYLINSFGTKTPLNITAVSDETVMERKGPADFVYKLLIGFVNETGLPKTQNYVECQLDFADSTDEASVVRKTVLSESYSVLFEDVVEGQQYRFRLRYVGEDGRTGPWTSWQNHTIVGKSGAASNVTTLSYTITETGIVLSWDGCTDLDYDTTLVKVGSDWNTATLIFNGKSTSIPITRPATGNYEFLVKHVDTSGNESAVAATTGVISYTNTLIDNAGITLTDSGELQGGGGGSIDIGKLPGTIEVAQVPVGSEFIKITNSLPTSYAGEVISYNNKLYRWTTSNPVVDYAIGPPTNSSSFFGQSTSISSNGEVLVVGAPYYDGGAGLDQGAVYTYNKIDNNLVYQSILLDTIDPGSTDLFGYSVSLDSAGLKLVVSATQHDGTASNSGRVYTYTRNSINENWSSNGYVSEVGPTPYPSDLFGYSVSLSGDGNTLVVGSRGEDYTDISYSNTGIVYIYSWDSISTNNWVLAHTIQYPEEITASNLYFGYSVSISRDGNTLVISSVPGNTSSGKIYTYKFINGVWTRLSKVIEHPDGAATTAFGGSLALTEDGSTLIVGAHISTSGSLVAAGAIYQYDFSVYDGGTWILRGGPIYDTIDPGVNDYFGRSLTVSSNGQIIAVGVAQYDAVINSISYSNIGRVYIYSVNKSYTAEVPTTDLVGSITTQQLATDLTSRIDLIDGPSTLQNSVSNRLLSYATTESLDGYATTVALETFSKLTAGPNGTEAQYTVKIDNAGHISGFGLSSESTTTASSEFAVRADKFALAPPAVVSGSAPTQNLFVGYVWLDTSVTPNVTKYYTGTTWSTEPQALPFVVQTTPTTVNGETVDPGVYIPNAYIQNGSITNAKIGNATIDSAKISSVNAATITTGTLSADRIASNSITTNKLVVTSKGGQTILSDDPMFQDPTLWNYDEGITFENFTQIAGAKGTTYVQNSAGTDKIITSARVYEITPLSVYRLSSLVYKAGASNRKIIIFINFYDYNGLLLLETGWGNSEFSGIVYEDVPTGTYVRQGGTFGYNITNRAIPANTRYCKIGVLFNSSSTGTSSGSQRSMDLRLDELIVGNELIVDGSITAAKINTRGLSILNEAGTVIFDAGSTTPIANTAVSGLGSFATKSSLDYTEVAGTKPPSDANNTYIDANGNIQGVSSGSGTSVSNNAIKQNRNLIRKFEYGYYRDPEIILGSEIRAADGTALSIPSNVSFKSWQSNFLNLPATTNNYVVSFMAFVSTGTRDLHVDLFPDTLPENVFTITTTPTLYKAYWTPVASAQDLDQARLRFFTQTTGAGDIYIYNAQLEYGTEYTPWKPHLLDVQNTSISIDTDGKIQNIGTGAGTSISNAFINNLSFTSNGVTVAGDSIVKLSGANSWDSQAYSNEYYYKNAYLSFTANSADKYVIVGLNTDPTTNASWNSLDYAFYLGNTGTIRIYENGTDIGNFGNYTAGDLFIITYDGTNVIYYKNGVPVRTVAANITNSIYFDSSFYSVYSSINNVRFGPLPAGLDLTKINSIKTTADNAISGLAAKLDKASSEILGINSSDTTRMAGIRVGDLDWNPNTGVRTSGKGLALTPYGILGHDGTNSTFTIDTNGNAVFKGDISGASGTFSGLIVADSIQTNTISTNKLELDAGTSNSNISNTFSGNYYTTTATQTAEEYTIYTDWITISEVMKRSKIFAGISYYFDIGSANTNAYWCYMETTIEIQYLDTNGNWAIHLNDYIIPKTKDFKTAKVFTNALGQTRNFYMSGSLMLDIVPTSSFVGPPAPGFEYSDYIWWPRDDYDNSIRVRLKRKISFWSSASSSTFITVNGATIRGGDYLGEVVSTLVEKRL